jgi:hypothetical protein
MLDHPCRASFTRDEPKLLKALYVDSGLLTSINSGLCRGALQGASGIAGVPGLGSVAAPFFLTFFVVFNQAEPSISFAPQVQP